MRIVTLTINPAVDKSTTVSGVQPDAKLRCKAPKFEPGGGGINVSRAIKKLGGESLALYFSGGPTGELMYNLLEKEGVAQQVLPIAAWTRENFIVVDTETNEQYRFGMPGAKITQKEQTRLFDQLKALDPKPEFLVASGSLPPGMDDNFYVEVADFANKAGIKLILDTSGQALINGVNAGVYLTKPNLGELCSITGESCVEATRQEEIARKVIESGKAEIVVVSMGPKGAMIVTKDLLEYIPAPNTIKKSTVGAGDSMVGGMTLKLAERWDVVDAARYGVASGTAATMNEGTELCHKEDVDTLFSWIMENRMIKT